MYFTLIPVIIAGVLNMVWCKLPILGSLKKPIDGGANAWDGKRIFGDNKTWKGLVGYVLLNMLCSVLWGMACNKAGFLYEHDFFYVSNKNTLFFNLISGALLGLAYSLFELPNSFLKRRLGIVPGKAPTGFRKAFFVTLDQADSVFGCVLVVCVFYKMSVPFYFAYVALGAATHIILNMLLYLAHLRKNMF